MIHPGANVLDSTLCSCFTSLCGLGEVAFISIVSTVKWKVMKAVLRVQLYSAEKAQSEEHNVCSVNSCSHHYHHHHYCYPKGRFYNC